MKALDNNDICATVRVHTTVTKGNLDGITEINKTDFDPAKHQLVDDGAQPSLNLTQSGGAAPQQAALVNTDPSKPKVSALLIGPQNVGAPDPMEAGMISGFAHSRSGLDTAAWNALPDADREAKIAAELATIRTANGYKPPAFG